MSIILAFSILILSGLPCADTHVCEEENNSELSLNHEHESGEEDTCSPLCVCSCCGVIYTLEDIPVLFTERANKHNYHYAFHYAFHYHFTFTFSIWRPPTF